MTGVPIPLTLKPVPEIDALLTETLDPPELVTLALSVWLDPTGTVPKLSAEGLLVSDPAVTPAALSATVREGFILASLTILRLPLAEPALAGAKVMERFWLCPLASVNGAVTPLTLNPLPLATA